MSSSFILEMTSARPFILVGFAINLLVLDLVQSHSWITCTDYGIKNHDVYDVNMCRAFPRAANKRLPKTKTFAQDTGFDTKPSENSPCQARRNDAEHYDNNHPVAVYYPGQQVVLAHPMKNHGADSACTNPYIPDNGNFIYRGPRNGGSDPTLSEFRANLVFDLGVSPTGQASEATSSVYPKPGFQNAPAFCDKSKATTDNALGTYSFNVPDLLPGRYTFLWLWAFNSKADLYSTCFEVDIVANKRERDDRLLDNGFSDLREPCGGDTSNPDIKGNCNNDPTTTTTLKTTSVTRKVKNNEENEMTCMCPCICGSLGLQTNAFLILAAFLWQRLIAE